MPDIGNAPSPHRGTFLAIMLGMLIGVPAFLFMIVITYGAILIPMVGFLLIGALATVHYLLWGRSMSNAVAAEREEEAEDEAEADGEDWPLDGPHGPRRY